MDQKILKCLDFEVFIKRILVLLIGYVRNVS